MGSGIFIMGGHLHLPRGSLYFCRVGKPPGIIMGSGIFIMGGHPTPS